MRVFTVKAEQYMIPILKLVATSVREGLNGGLVEIVVQRVSKTREQEKKYHSMIGDIAKQVDLYGRKHKTEDWKALLVREFEIEMQQAGTPLSHPGRTIVSRDGTELITVRPSTKDFRKSEAAQFIEYLYSEGIDMGVRFTEKSLEYLEEAQRYLGRAA